MIKKPQDLPDHDRRKLLLASGAAWLWACTPVLAAPGEGPLHKALPGDSGDVPAIGMGTWITFNVGRSTPLREARLEVMRTFLEYGGGMVDSSPMYGSSEEVVGYCLERLSYPAAVFSATKVWTQTRWLGLRQMQASQRLWGLDSFDLMQVHNLVDWRTHLATLLEWKQAGRIRYIGITTSHGMRHDELESVMREQPVDFVQFTYNVLDRQAEQRLLPLAAERGLGVIINCPFQGGRLFDRIASRAPLPDFAREIDCRTWAAYFLKFVISHPAVTCAIPATSRVDHMRENMEAGYGRLPDQSLRTRMARHVQSL
jgi:diketogulonate reductase-like aldo/keto reductase